MILERNIVVEIVTAEAAGRGSATAALTTAQR